MPKIGCFGAFSHFFCFWGPFFENFKPKICFFIHQMWNEISQMTNICHKCTQNGTFKFDQKRNCPLSNARWGVLPINFKSATQTEEMGAGTTELLFQVLSTFISTWLIHHNHGTVFVFVVFCISLFAGSIYLYQHLTNLPQSPNWNVPLSPHSNICSLQPHHTYE